MIQELQRCKDGTISTSHSKPLKLDFDLQIFTLNSCFVDWQILLPGQFTDQFSIRWKQRERRPVHQFSIRKSMLGLMQWTCDAIINDLSSQSQRPSHVSTEAFSRMELISLFDHHQGLQTHRHHLGFSGFEFGNTNGILPLHCHCVRSPA